MSHPTSQPRGYSNPDLPARNHFTNAQIACDFPGRVQHPRSDSFVPNSTVSDYPTSAVGSPVFGDFNFPFNGSPHSSAAGGVDSNVEVAGGSCYYNQRAMSDAPSMTGSTNFGAQHRASVCSTGQPNGSVAGSESWTQSPSRGQAVPNADMAPAATGDQSTQKDMDGQGNAAEEDDSGKVPPWSELKTKAGKERKRLPLACIACRR